MRQQPNTPKNIYARGADDGLWLGIYLCVLFFSCVGSLSIPMLNVLAFTLIVGVPPMVYFFLRRTHVAAHGMTSFSALWMQGIMMFGCACLIFGAVSYVYLQWVDSTLLIRAIDQAVEAYRAQPSEAASELVHELEMISETPSILSPLNVTFGWMWLGMFSGSILSMIITSVVRLRRVPINTDSQNLNQ